MRRSGRPKRFLLRSPHSPVGVTEGGRLGSRLTLHAVLISKTQGFRESCSACTQSWITAQISAASSSPPTTVSCAGVAGGAEAIVPHHCRIPSEPAARKRRVTRPACTRRYVHHAAQRRLLYGEMRKMVLHSAMPVGSGIRSTACAVCSVGTFPGRRPAPTPSV